MFSGGIERDRWYERVKKASLSIAKLRDNISKPLLFVI